MIVFLKQAVYNLKNELEKTIAFTERTNFSKGLEKNDYFLLNEYFLEKIFFLKR